MACADHRPVMKMTRTHIALPFILLLLAGTFACAGNINPERQVDDAILSTNVREALQADPDLRRYDIVVNAQGGTVTLLGSVRSNAERSRATTVAQGVQGVSRVVNELRVN